MAGVAPADALHAGTDEPNVVGRDAAEASSLAGTSRTKESTPSSPFGWAHDQPEDAVDDVAAADPEEDNSSIASSTGTAGRRSARLIGFQQISQQQTHPQPRQRHQTRQLRKSASTSTTDTVASAQTNASTEVRAAVSNRASRSALNQRSKSTAPSPTIPQAAESGFEPASSVPRYQDFSFAFGQGSSTASSSPFVTSTVRTLEQDAGSEGSGIVQVNPAPPPSPPPQHRGRGGVMASSFLPAIFGRRRPTSSASAATTSSGFAANNPPPPGPQAFDFSSILNSLEADDAARADIDAIAEICGHSRLSLANAHANHRDPVGELVGSPTASSQYTDTYRSTGLEPVRESGSARGEDGEPRLGSPTPSQAGEDRWPLARTSDRDGEAAVVTRLAYGRSASAEEEGRARRQLTRVRDASNERDQRRRRG